MERLLSESNRGNNPRRLMFTKVIINAIIICALALSAGCSRTNAISRDYVAENASLYIKEWHDKNRKPYYKIVKRKNFNMMYHADEEIYFTSRRIKVIHHILDSLGAINTEKDTIICIREEPATCVGCPYDFIIKTMSDTIKLSWETGRELSSSNPEKVETLQSWIDANSKELWFTLSRYENRYKTFLQWDKSKIMLMLDSLGREFEYSGERTRVSRIILENNRIKSLESIAPNS